MPHTLTSDLITHHVKAGLPSADVTELVNTAFMQKFLANVEAGNVKEGTVQLGQTLKFVAGNVDFVAGKLP